MARRRKGWSTGARVAYGLGEGASQLFAQMMRDITATRTAERAADMQEARDARTLARQGILQDRQQAATTRRSLIEKLPQVASGELSPDAFLSMMSASGVELFPTEHGPDVVGTGEYEREKAESAQATDSLMQSLRPPLRRKLETTLGADIDKAKTAAEVPDLAAIIAKARAVDDRASAGGLDPSMFSDPSDPSQAVFTMAPEVRDYAERAQNKRHALRAPMDQALAQLPPHLQPFSELLRSGVIGNLSTDALQSPAEREASEIRVRNATREPDQPKAQQFVIRNGSVIPIQPGTALPGDIPYSADAMQGMGGEAADARSMRTAAALNSIDQLKELAPQRLEGPAGIVQGALESARGAAGYNTQVKQYNALLGPTAMQMAVAIQGASGLSNAEREVMKGMLGSIATMDYASQMALLDRASQMVRSNADVDYITVKDPQTGAEVKRWVPKRSRMPGSVINPGATTPEIPNTNPLYQQYLQKRGGG